jgi:hypothetical protein
MLSLFLLLAAGPGPHVDQRADAQLPPVAVATEGLIADGRLLRVDPAALFDDDDDALLLAGGAEPVDRALADLSQAIEEEAAPLPAPAAQAPAQASDAPSPDSAPAPDAA